jgi:hypothetical protein
MPKRTSKSPNPADRNLLARVILDEATDESSHEEKLFQIRQFSQQSSRLFMTDLPLLVSVYPALRQKKRILFGLSLSFERLIGRER